MRSTPSETCLPNLAYACFYCSRVAAILYSCGSLFLFEILHYPWVPSLNIDDMKNLLSNLEVSVLVLNEIWETILSMCIYKYDGGDISGIKAS